MHIIQKQLLDLIANQENLGSLSLRKIAELIGAKGKPQTAKYHLQQLQKDGLIQMNLEEGILKLVRKGFNKVSMSPLYSVPVVGSANCGPATIFAEQNIEKYLKISSSLLPRNKSNLFIVIADGDSMNDVSLDGKTIESGDYVLVDKSLTSYKNGDIVLAIIDGMATIKEFNREEDHVVLRARSTIAGYLPIYLGEGDEFIINGKVVGIIKG